MDLEIISRLPEKNTQPIPLLFVHGAFCGAWVWDEHVLPYFAEKGFAAHAVSLRGHGKSEGHALLPLTGVADYVEDLTETVQAMDKPPILIGHSMGGVVVQRYLQDHTVPGAVLLGAGPPYGMIASAAVTFVQNPVLSTQVSLMPVLQLFGDNPVFMDMSRRTLFSDRVPEDEARRFLHRTQMESMRAIFDLSLPHLPRNKGTPLLILGAEKDYFVTPYMVHATAKAYKTEAEIFPHMGHAMMVEAGWEMVAERIIKWINGGMPANLSVPPA
ncbi:MAG: alpha/beta hydrolase [Gammaproteobacteria bacterium]|nr:alpha/beta hydrolase [Gammaproteobacteria bacterium]NNJ84889.1 alpha/beta hydrolase [Gammaproteobacteria bacterium]